jgi:hypothetical protein
VCRERDAERQQLVHAAFSQVDADGSGTIGYEEFKQFWQQLQREQPAGAGTEEDRSNEETDDAAAAAAGAEQEVLDRMTEMWHEADEDGSGELDLDEFANMLLWTGAQRNQPSQQLQPVVLACLVTSPDTCSIAADDNPPETGPPPLFCIAYYYRPHHRRPFTHT